MLRPRPELLLTLALACVLPYGGATGVEVRWSLREVNAADGDDARRLRTCAGAGLSQVEVEVVDADDPGRAAAFAHACSAGNPPPAARATEPAEIFIDLRAGAYDVTATALAAGGTVLAGAAIEVEAHAIATLDLELARPPRPLELELTGACTTLTAALRYADPAADLYLDDPDAPPAVYRQQLRSDRDLRLGGQTGQPCAGLVGLHRVVVDPGRYLLELAVDGRACKIPLAVEDSPVRLALDLENPACGG
jgi:hypothetical protein